MHIIRAYRGTKYLCKVSLEKKRKEQRSAGLLTTKGRTTPDTLSLDVSVLLYLLRPFCHAFNYPTVYMRRYFITRERHAP